MLTIEDIVNRYHISYRAVETNLSKIKDMFNGTEYMQFNGQKWLLHESLVPQLTARQYVKHYTEFDNGVKVDEIDLKTLVTENDLKTFTTIAPKGIKSLSKMKDIIRDVFEYYKSTSSEPVFFVYSIENNTDYLNEKENRGYHAHFVTTATFNRNDQSQINEILLEQLPNDKVHKQYTVSVSPYVMGLGIGALNYTLKYKEHTGAYIK